MEPQVCILCHSSDIRHFYEDQSKAHASDYYHCQNCRLIFAPPKDQPDPEDERARYDTHNNDPDDKGYRDFLSQLFDPLNALLVPKSEGLDFGSGPGPTLYQMFEEEGHSMEIYDPFYADNPSVFDRTYDFITATEVAEHLHNPNKEFSKIWGCLRPGGYLGIMTKLVMNDKQAFAAWYYRRDITHVTFYMKETFAWLANKWKASLAFHGNRVIIFHKTE